MKFTRILSIITALGLLLTVTTAMPVFAEEAAATTVLSLPNETDYRKYISNTNENAGEDIVLHCDYEIDIKEGTELNYTLDIPNGSYELKLEYMLTSRENLECEVLIDGSHPFYEAENLEFFGLWKNSNKERKDGAGNEISPEQILAEEYVFSSASDITGKNLRPFLFSFSEGRHNITIKFNVGKAKIKSVLLAAPEVVASYKRSDDISENKKADTIIIEGEEADYKSEYSLIPLVESTSAKVMPNDPVKERLNYIGGSNWSSSGDSLTWKFNVKEAGWYSLNAIYRQNIELGAISYRHLTIDGKTPFEEAYKLKFKYSADWDYYSFGENDEDYYIWLDAREHILTLTATSGDMAEVYARLQEITSVMGDLYVDITMLVGDTVDTYRSYEFFKQIPEYNERMEYCVKELKKLAGTIEKLQEKSSGSMVSTISGAAEILVKMLEQPYSAHKYKSAFYTEYTNLGALIGSVVNMPLDIDRIFLVPYGKEKPQIKVPFVDSISFGIKRFLKTFSKDYDNISVNENDNEALTLWVNWGRDQAQVLTALINEGFTEKYGINVNTRVVNATIIQGILAGKGPDVMLHMARTEPVNLAMRGALVDLTQFSDYNEVSKQFSADGTVPYTYKDGVYALPDTESFEMLFIRSDVLADFGLEIPKTWDDFLNVATTLQRSNLQVYIPETLLPTLLQQRGLPLYDEEEGITTLTQASQIECFIWYTDLFNKYKFPKSVSSFFDRFRIGSIPMGIYDYTLQTQLEIAAPEIEGRWEVVPLPATVNQGGNTSCVSAGSGTGCAITKLSKNPERAWEFIKWWVSAETQRSYSDNLESLLGPLGRVSTSNLSAFERLGWDKDRLPYLLDQKANVVNLPVLPGSYYVDRGIGQAFWNVVEQNANPNDAMLEWGAVVDGEMRRKKAEYK